MKGYILGHSDHETRRLILQHQIYGPITRRFFEGAGIVRGMKVLDVGSGAGDVALLAADLVGPSGRVVGVDRNAEILETARERAATAGCLDRAPVGGCCAPAAGVSRRDHSFRREDPAESLCARPLRDR
jgi:predicted RNA methylase